jgi:hypothetical protein
MSSKIKLLFEDALDWWNYKFAIPRHIRKMDKEGRCYKCGGKDCECHLYSF